MRIDTTRIIAETIAATTDDDAPLDFYTIALGLGYSDDEAEIADERCTAIIMRSRGAI